MTFSIAGRCGRTGRFGVAVSSSSPAVAARCAHVRAGTGAVCSQNVTDPRLGPRLLDALATGLSAADALQQVVASEKQAPWRQLSVVGVSGPPAVHSGTWTLGLGGGLAGEDVVAAGNLLADLGVLAAALAAFAARSSSSLAERLVAALVAADDAGGEEGPAHSAGLVVVADLPWPVTDLRVDWTDGDPVAELASLWRRWEPQEDDYVQRALDPDASPGYGVPGDDRAHPRRSLDGR